ncbi:hypothetical protein BJX70DRAFT_398146 [Aspergillus crustosus]
MPSFKHQHRRKHRTFHPPPAFWDNLTKLWLTKSGLREVSRRCTPVYSDQPSIPQLFAPDFLRSCSTASIKEIKRLSRYGGPDLSDIVGCTIPANLTDYSMEPVSSGSKGSTSTPKTGKTTIYDRNFEDHLADNGVSFPSSRYPDGSKPLKPVNFEGIRERLRAERHSLALSKGSLEEEYEAFIELNEQAGDEQLVMTYILPILEGKRKTSSKSGAGHPFINLAPLTDGSLDNAKPDFYYGAISNQLKQEVKKQLSNQIVPSTRSNRPVVPNFFLELKGHDGSTSVAIRQACYDCALGARAMFSLQQLNRAGESDPGIIYDNKAYTITATFHQGHLTIYTTHPTIATSKDRSTDYMLTRVGYYSLLDTPESYQRALSAYRNARDLAEEYRNMIIKQANARYAASQKHAGDLDGFQGSKYSRLIIRMMD